MEYLLKHWEEISSAIGLFYAAISILATLTPSNKDNTWLEKLGKFLDRIGCKIKK